MKRSIKKTALNVGIIAGILGLAFFIFRDPDIPVETLSRLYAQENSGFIETDAASTHFRNDGPLLDSIPLVLLHGTGSSLHTWQACAQEWSKTRRVLSMDLPGFGLTGPSRFDDYTIDGYIAFLHQFLRVTGVNRCYLAGNSLGGLIAYSYAAKYPEQVTKLILLDPAGFSLHDSEGTLAFTLARTPVLKYLLTFFTPTSVVRKSVEQVYGNPALVTDSLVHLYRMMALRSGNRNALLKRMQLPQTGDTAILSSLQQPTLIIWGDKDRLIPPDHAYKFQKALPRDTLVMLKGIGHIPMEESPEQVIPLVESFLRDTTLRAPVIF